MSKQTPFLHRRGDAYSFRIAVPLELRAYIGCRELTKSLRTSDKNIAFPIALELAAKVKRLFFDINNSMSNNSDKNKSDIEIRVRVALEEIKRRHVIETHEIEIKNLHQARVQELKVLNAKLEVYEKLIGEKNYSKPAATEEDNKKPHTEKNLIKLSEVIPVWITNKKPALSSISAFKFAVERFEKKYPHLTITTIDTEHIDEFVEWLQSEGLSPKTISKDHGMLRALFNIALKKKWIKSNPASSTLLPTIKQVRPPVRGYSSEELQLIFNAPVFRSGERPSAGKGEAAYWIPLLLLFTGARREEICQITTERVRIKENISVIDIDTIDEDGSLKTISSIRTIPIHQMLLDLGFLAFVNEVRKNGHKMLFHLLKPNARGQYGQKWGDWWGKYQKRVIGIHDNRISPSHSFRHLFITECRRASLPADCKRYITGHKISEKDDHDIYGDFPIEALFEWINKIKFSNLDLSHLTTKSYL